MFEFNLTNWDLQKKCVPAFSSIKEKGLNWTHDLSHQCSRGYRCFCLFCIFWADSLWLLSAISFFMFSLLSIEMIFYNNSEDRVSLAAKQNFQFNYLVLCPSPIIRTSIFIITVWSYLTPSAYTDLVPPDGAAFSELWLNRCLARGTLLAITLGWAKFETDVLPCTRCLTMLNFARTFINLDRTPRQHLQQSWQLRNSMS